MSCLGRSPSPSGSARGLVLIVDDSPVQLNAFCVLLDRAGFVPITANDGEAGLALARQAMPELIVSDVVMPRMDGIELCRRLKSDPATEDIPVLLFSALDYNDAALSEGFEAGVDDYIEVTAPKILLSKKAERLVAQYREKRARRKAEEKYRSLVESLPVVVYVAEAEPPYSTIYVSPAIESLGYPLSEWYSGSVSWIDLLHPGDRGWVMKQTAEAGVETEYEYRMIARDGSVRWFHDHGRFVTGEGDQPCRCWQGIMTDITARKTVEEALRDSQAFYESLVESLPQCVFRKDRDGRYMFANRRMCSLLRRPLSEIVGKTAFDLYPESEARKYKAEDVRVMESGDVIDTIEECLAVDGRDRYIEVIKAPVRDSQGTIIGVQGILWDVSERKELEHQLLQSQKMEAIGTLAGGVAHDFNNVLTVIKGYSELLLRGLSDDFTYRSQAEEIRRAAERAATLTQQLLAFSRKQVRQPKEMSLNAVVSDMETMLRRLIGEDIILATALRPDLAPVTADPGQIEQVIMNLVVNAREAMPAGGTLTIETGGVCVDEAFVPQYPGLPSGCYIMLAVSDTGCGMDRETRSRIFEPFFTTKKDKGTGLGLSTVYGIVKQSNGHIDVYSELGTGTTFKLLFPASADGCRVSLAQTSNTNVLSGSETVLVVEDEAVVRDLIRKVLEGYGYTVLAAGNGNEALEICVQRSGSIDAVLTDVVMPQMSGGELAKHIHDRYPDLKMVFMSGYTDGAIASHGILDPDVAFIHKPFTPASLTNKLRETLDHLPCPVG